MQVNIAIDCDGVLADSMSSWKTIAYREGVQDPFDHTYNGIYKVRCSDGEIFANKLFGEYRSEWLLNAKPFPDVADFIEKVENNEHIHYWIVTSRGEDTKYATIEWLANNNITGYEDVIFTQNKLDAPCNTIVDDHYKNTKQYSDNARLAYLLSRSYNMKYNVNRRVSGLMEVYRDLLKYI